MEDQLTILREKIGGMVVENPLTRLKVRLKCAKRKFSKNKAKQVIIKAQRSRDERRKECRYYFCVQCKAYHVTSKE